MGEDWLKQQANPGLLGAIAAYVFAHSPETERAVWRALLYGQLIVPAGYETDSAGRQIGPVEPMLVGSQHGNYLAVFTDWHSLQLWPHKTKPTSLAILDSQAVFELARVRDVSQIAINPNGPLGIWVEEPEMGILATGAIPPPRVSETVTLIGALAGECVCLGPPRVPPPAEFVEQLREVLEGKPDVAKGFLFEGSLGVGTQLTLGVAFTGGLGYGPVAEFIQEIQPVLANGARLTGGSIDFVVLTGKLLESVEGRLPAFLQQGSDAQNATRTPQSGSGSTAYIVRIHPV